VAVHCVRLAASEARQQAVLDEGTQLAAHVLGLWGACV
jgi:hypothetical protein